MSKNKTKTSKNIHFKGVCTSIIFEMKNPTSQSTTSNQGFELFCVKTNPGGRANSSA